MKPIAVRVKDFKSIRDSGEVTLSGDGVTCLAGQNESGKTAFLEALQEFDRSPDAELQPDDFLPDGVSDPSPAVAVLFSCGFDEIKQALSDESMVVPDKFTVLLLRDKSIWIERNLLDGSFHFAEEIEQLWEQTSQEGQTYTPVRDFAKSLWSDWPPFVYFDSFDDVLPRQIALDQIDEKDEASIVSNFLHVAEIDIDKLKSLPDGKAMENYLSGVSATITSDFLSYWNQNRDTSTDVQLKVRHQRDENGIPFLHFYIGNESVSQYPDQRSRGFVWFLSFYLRLTASNKRLTPQSGRVLLIDEPGSFLHARAQVDIIRLFENYLTSKQNNIVVYSTHSPYMIPSEKLHRVRVVVNEKPGGTIIADRLTDQRIRKDKATSADALTPVLTAIGLDFRNEITFAHNRNLIVEGISDCYYLTEWLTRYASNFEHINVIPSTSSSQMVTLASIFTGWGIPFVALFDNDDQGKNSYEKMERNLGIPTTRLLKHKSAGAIEDVFASQDFVQLLPDNTATPSTWKPSTLIRRHNIDKVLAARRYRERISQGNFQMSRETEEAVQDLVNRIANAVAGSEGTTA